VVLVQNDLRVSTPSSNFASAHEHLVMKSNCRTILGSAPG
jgi:hypothetical protein